MQVQLVRIQLRVPEYGWTTQKVFHLLNALVCSLRCGSFLFRGQMQQLHPDAVRLVLFDLPGMASKGCVPRQCQVDPQLRQPMPHQFGFGGTLPCPAPCVGVSKRFALHQHTIQQRW